MTNPYCETYQIQFAFLFKETSRLLDMARSLSDEEYRAETSYSHESIHATFAHLLGASQLWRQVVVNREPIFSSSEETADHNALTTLFRTEQEEWNNLIASLSDADLHTSIVRQSPFGTVTLSIWQTLQHVVLHGITHLAEIAQRLSAAGHSPGDIDFLFYQPTP